MSHSARNRTTRLEAALPPLEVSPPRIVPPGELERRRAQLARAREIRSAIRAACGPLDMTATDLKHLARQEAEE